MEQQLQPLHTFSNFIQPLLKNISHAFLKKEDTLIQSADFMPLFDVIQLIHEAYYFNKTILLQFELLTSNGDIITRSLTGTIKTSIQENNYFVFQEEDNNISHFISLNQVLQIIKIS